MRKFAFVAFVFILCSGCIQRVPADAKVEIRDNHAISKVLAKRVDDPKRKPTQEELEEYMKSSAKAWESMDRMINKWKPRK